MKLQNKNNSILALIIVLVCLVLIPLKGHAEDCDMMAMIAKEGYYISLMDSSTGSFNDPYDYFEFMKAHSTPTTNDDGYGVVFYKNGLNTIYYDMENPLDPDNQAFYLWGPWNNCWYQCHGPDSSDNYWNDSNHPAGPDYNWVDISGLVDTAVIFTHNDTASGPFDIGFDFTFYDSTYSEFIISPNGWIGFGDDWTDYHNYSIPRVDAPRPAIFGFWDDLHPADTTGGGGSVYYYSNGIDSLIVWFDNVIHHVGQWNGTYDFEMILTSDSTIKFQYRYVEGDINSATIGIQNAEGYDALQVVCNADYVEDSLAILFSTDVYPEPLDIAKARIIDDPTNEAVIVLGHDRDAGSTYIEGNHPFRFNWEGKTYTFEHNGSIDDYIKGALYSELGGTSWFQQHPSNWANWGDPLEYFIDSEILFHWIMKKVIDNDEYIISGIHAALTATVGNYDLRDIFQHPTSPNINVINFVLSNGEDLYVFKNAYDSWNHHKLSWKECPGEFYAVKTQNEYEHPINQFNLVYISRYGVPYTFNNFLSIATPAVVVIDPIAIPINTLSEVTISVYEEDAITPIPDVNIDVSGLGLFGTLEGITDSTGTCILNMGCQYGGTEIIQVIGWREGDNYNLFEETIDVTDGISLTNPEIWITTTFGLADTFGLNMPATVHFTQDETDCDYAIYVVDPDTFIIETINDSIIYTPSSLTNIYGYIMKTGYNLYSELFTTIEVYGTISGLVTESEGGNPISNAEVRFYEQGGDPTTPALFNGITNFSGYYEVTDEYPVDYYDIYIDKWGYNPYEELNYFLGYGLNNHNIVLDPVESSVINGTIWDDNGSVSDAILYYYRSDNGELYATVQVSGSIGIYNVTLPNFTYELYVTAPGHVPYIGTITITSNSTIDYHLGLAVLYSDFENNNGDLVNYPPTGGWEWGEPTAGGIEAYSGINVWATNLNGYYINNADWFLDTPEFTAPSSGILIFYHYYDFEQGPSTGILYDGGNVKISTDGGIAYTLITPGCGYDGNVEALDDQGFGATNLDWELVKFDISNYEGENAILRWHFASDYGVYEYYGWYIDDFLIGDSSSSYEIPIYSVDETKLNNNLTLYQNYPNPVRNFTTISFSIPKGIEKAELKIYNIKGQLVRKFLIANNQSSIVWDGKNDKGKQLSNGIYLYRLKAGKKSFIKKMILMR
ncbi:MAG: T9SS type A sorting domain-containing protein [Candidatus Cloacimonetes bacterium]|nr:T9SS type A sorting domain-containing protein [Candidatus Cloacimonadota bacterium]